MKIALFPGSFDPVTEGHEEIIRRAGGLFDRIVVAIGVNSQKKTLFSLEQRLKMLEATFEGLDFVKVASFEGLTVDFAKKEGAGFLLRGLRNGADLEYEKPIALINQHLNPELETIFMLSKGQNAHVSSTLVREVINYGGKLEGLVPAQIIPIIYNK